MNALSITKDMKRFQKENNEPVGNFMATERRMEQFRALTPGWLMFHEIKSRLCASISMGLLLFGVWVSAFSNHADSPTLIWWLVTLAVFCFLTLWTMEDRPSQISAKMDDREERIRADLYRFVGALQSSLELYNYAVRCKELGLFPERMKTVLARTGEQLSRAIAYVDHKVKLWNLREDRKGLKGIPAPEIGIEWERLRESIESIGEIVGSDELEQLENEIQSELALLDVQELLGALPRSQEM